MRPGEAEISLPKFVSNSGPTYSLAAVIMWMAYPRAEQIGVVQEPLENIDQLRVHARTTMLGDPEIRARFTMNTRPTQAEQSNLGRSIWMPAVVPGFLVTRATTSLETTRVQTQDPNRLLKFAGSRPIFRLSA